MQAFDPPYCGLAQAPTALAQAGYAVLQAGDLTKLAGLAEEPSALARYWEDLPPDAWLRDGGLYRFRRHASCVVDVASEGAGGAATSIVSQVPHRAHWQSVDYNALHGGIERWFEPVLPELIRTPAWLQLLGGLGELFSRVRPCPRWFVEAHQFRIDTREGIGRPTPEGAHRDGVDFVAVILVARHGVKGGETRVFDAAGPSGVRFTLRAPWSALLLDDTRMIHETTPIQPAAADGHRDTLVLTFRSGGFQAPPTA